VGPGLVDNRDHWRRRAEEPARLPSQPDVHTDQAPTLKCPTFSDMANELVEIGLFDPKEAEE
jgi:hypothetical protein